MAIAVIGGMMTSTLLTLIVIPVVYELIDGVRDKTKHET
jgi:HAE1 family hydrophobic/amphiphilic exporter-1